MQDRASFSELDAALAGVARSSLASFRASSALTTAGLARPWVAFITWPTRKPSAAFLPPFQSSTTLGCWASTWSTTAPSAPASATWVRPSRLDDRLGASSPERYICSKTSLAILPLIVPSSIRRRSPARCAGSIGQAAPRGRRRPAARARARSAPSSRPALGVAVVADRRLEVVGDAPALGEQVGLVRGERVGLGEAPPPGRRQLRQGRPQRVRPRAGRRRAAAGRARGSSGSRARTPWSASTPSRARSGSQSRVSWTTVARPRRARAPGASPRARGRRARAGTSSCS